MSELDLSTVKAGDYELLVLSWDEITSKPGQPFDYVTHRKGDVVTLDVEQARRLLAVNAVKPVEKSKSGKSGKGDDSGKGAPPADELDISKSAAKVLDWVGEDKERAAAALAAEQAKETPRGNLVGPLEALLIPVPPTGDAGTGAGD